MPSRFQLSFSKASIDDLDAIREYIDQDSTGRALQFAASLLERISILEKSPSLGKPSPDKILKKQGYRVLVLDSYLVYYIVSKPIVQIIRVIHGARTIRLH